MKTRRQWWLLTFLVISSIFIAQCGGAAPPAPAADAPTGQTSAAGGESQAATGDQPIELRLWMHENPSFRAGNEELIRRFQEMHPNVTITLETFPYDVYIQTLQTAMPAGTEADIMELFGTWVCGYADRLAEMPDTVMSYAEASEVFYEAPLNGYYCDGKLYGLPHEFNVENGAALVNPALFEAAGVAYPPEWNTFQDLLNDAQQIAQYDGDTMTVSGFHFVSGDGLAFQLLAGILQRGGEYWKPDGSGLNFLTDEARATVEDMKSWVDTYKVTDPFLFNGETNWVGDAFFANLVGIGFVGSWVVPEGRSQYPDLEFDYVLIPPYAGTEQIFAADSGWGKVVSPNSPHREMAFEFVKFATANPEGARVWNVATGTIPAMIEVAEDPTLLEEIPWIEAPLQILPNGRYIGPLPDRDLFWYDIVQLHLLGVLQGTETVDQALEAIDAEANAMFQ